LEHVFNSCVDVAIAFTIPPVTGIGAGPNDRIEEIQEVEYSNPAGEDESCPRPMGDFPIEISRRNTEEEAYAGENGEGYIGHGVQEEGERCLVCGV
jgi:hypothetical protein